MKLNVCLVAAVILFHATQAALFRQTSYTYDRHDGELRFIAKFGIQEYTQVELRGTFNNRTATNESVTFAFVPYETWSELNRLLVPSNNCSSMANLTSMIAHHWSVPGNVSDTISDNTETEYWFLVFLGYVYVDARSPWQKASGTQFDYEITLTNVPSDVFTQQFSYDMKGVAIVTMVATFTYLVLLAFQVAFSTYSCVCLKTRLHLLVKLFASLLLLELVGHGFQLAHMGVYTQDGVGLAPLGHVGAGLVILGNCFLVLLFLLISRGWQLTKAVLHYKIVTFVLWALYVVFSAIFFAWMVMYQEVYTACVDSPYQSWAAWLYQAYRILLLPYCLYELWHSYRQENDPLVQNVYRLFAMSFVVWFGYLPITVGVLHAVNLLEWTRVILSASLFFDLAANFILVILFCPLWSDYYFQFNSHLNTIVSAKRYTELNPLTSVFSNLF